MSTRENVWTTSDRERKHIMQLQRELAQTQQSLTEVVDEIIHCDEEVKRYRSDCKRINDAWASRDALVVAALSSLVSYVLSLEANVGILPEYLRLEHLFAEESLRHLSAYHIEMVNGDLVAPLKPLATPLLDPVDTLLEDASMPAEAAREAIISSLDLHKKQVKRLDRLPDTSDDKPGSLERCEGDAMKPTWKAGKPAQQDRSLAIIADASGLADHNAARVAQLEDALSKERVALQVARHECDGAARERLAALGAAERAFREREEVENLCHSLRQERDSLETARQAYIAQVNKLQSDVRDLEHALARERADLTEINSTVSVSLRRAIEAEDARSRAVQASQSLELTIESLRREVTRLQGERRISESRTREALATSERAAVSLARSDGAAESMRHEVEAAQLETVRARKMIESLQADIELLKKAVEDQTSLTVEVTLERDEFVARQHRSEELLQELRRELTLVRCDVGSSQAERDGAVADRQRVLEAMDSLQRDVAVARKEIGQANRLTEERQREAELARRHEGEARKALEDCMARLEESEGERVKTEELLHDACRQAESEAAARAAALEDKDIALNQKVLAIRRTREVEQALSDAMLENSSLHMALFDAKRSCELQERRLRGMQRELEFLMDERDTAIRIAAESTASIAAPGLADSSLSSGDVPRPRAAKGEPRVAASDTEFSHEDIPVGSLEELGKETAVLSSGLAAVPARPEEDAEEDLMKSSLATAMPAPGSQSLSPVEASAWSPLHLDSTVSRAEAIDEEGLAGFVTPAGLASPVGFTIDDDDREARVIINLARAMAASTSTTGTAVVSDTASDARESVIGKSASLPGAGMRRGRGMRDHEHLSLEAPVLAVEASLAAPVPPRSYPTPTNRGSLSR